MIKVVSKFAHESWLWFREHAQTPRAQFWLTAYSFVETIIVPFPVDPFMIAVLLPNVKRWVYFASITTLGSVLGAIAGYFIGYWAFDVLGDPLLHMFGVHDTFMKLKEVFDENAALLIFAAALTPIPNVVIPAGFFSMNFLVFLIAWVLGRAIRFYGVAYVVYAFGADTLSSMQRYINIATVVAALLVLGWVLMEVVQRLS
jgi:membrane protein YqaA with SNARE-associated domain